MGDVSILDDLDMIGKIDTENMLGIEENFSEQLQRAKAIGISIDVSKINSLNIKGIAFLGMGGSGFAGDFIKNLVKYECKLPIEIVKGYKLPAFVKNDWLAIAVSYSGDTEETISAATEALSRKCEVIFVSSGGKIEEIANQSNKIHIKVPGGFQPRAASGYLFIPLLILFEKLGFISSKLKEIDDSILSIKKLSEEYGRTNPLDKNYAKKIAFEIGSKLPIIYGYEGVLSSIAFRWKCQINENSKGPSFYNEFPELNHNETVGWDRLSDITKNFVLIYFKDSKESIRINTRINTTINLIKENFSKTIGVPVTGKSPLEKALNTMFLGGISSVYLAILNHTNPTPVDKIKVLKAELAKIKD